MTLKEMNFLVLSLLLATVPISANAGGPEKVMPDAGSQVLGKGGGMGKSYQENVAGPGQGTPEYRGSAAGANSEQEESKTQIPAQTEEALRSRQAKDGSGYGAGPGGERGLGSEGAPHHKQYGSPPPSSGK